MPQTCLVQTACRQSFVSQVPAVGQPHPASSAARPAASLSLSASPAGLTLVTLGRDKSARLLTTDDSALQASASGCSLLQTKKYR